MERARGSGRRCAPALSLVGGARAPTPAPAGTQRARLARQRVPCRRNPPGAGGSRGACDVTFTALINVRPRQNNPAIAIRDRELRRRVEAVVRSILDVESGG